MNIDIVEVLKDLDPNYELKPIEEALWKEFQSIIRNQKVRFVRQLDIPNLFEVIIDARFFYLMIKPEDVALIGTGGDCVNRYRYLFQEGHLTDQVKQKEVSHGMRDVAAMIDVEDLSLDKAIVETRGSGADKLYCFIDPMDVGSQSLVKTLRALQDITIYYFLLPSTKSDGVNAKVCDAIWQAINPLQTLDAVVDHKVERLKTNMTPTPLADVYQIADTFKIRGVPTYFVQSGHRFEGYRDVAIIRQKLEESRKLEHMANAE